MTPAKYCKQHGITLKEVSNLSGVSRETLNNWFHNKNDLFNIVLLGCLIKESDLSRLLDELRGLL